MSGTADPNPSAWPRIALKHLVDDRGITYGVVQPGEPQRDGVPIVRVNNFTATGLQLDDVLRIDPAIAARYSRSHLKGGEVLITLVGSIGQVAMAPRQMNGWNVARAVGVIPVRRDVPARWVAWCLQAPEARRYLEDRLNTTVQKTLNLRDLAAVAIPLPSTPEIEAVGSVLGALDDKIDSNRRLRRLIDELAGELFQASIRGRANDQTKVSSLIKERLLYISDGLRAKNAELAAEGLPFARAGTLNDGFDFSGADRVPHAMATAARSKCSAPGDVVFTSKGTVGRFALVDRWIEPFVYSPQLCFWRSLDHDRLPPVALFWWMQGAEAKQQFDALKGQTDMADYVSLRDQKSITMSLPPEDEMRRLAARLAPLATLSGSLRAESQTLGELRDALLPKLVSGQLRLPYSADTAQAIEQADTIVAAS